MKKKRIIALMISLLLLSSAQNVAVFADKVTDLNNSMDVATLLPLNAPCSDYLIDYYDADYFRFTTTKNGIADIVFDHVKLDGIDQNLWEVSVFNENKVVFQTAYVKGNVESAKLSVGLPEGTYYIAVKACSYTDKLVGVSYNITANFTENEYYEKEFNNNFDVANPVEVNKQYTAAIQNGQDVDFYSFTTTTNGNTELNFNHAKLSGIDERLWEITVMNELKKEFYTIVSRGNVESVKASVGLPAGTYYVRIKPYNSYTEGFQGMNYFLTVAFKEGEYYEKEFNDNIDVPSAMELNKTYTASLQKYDDVDYYSFSTKKNGNLNLKFNHPKLAGVDNSVWIVKILSDNKKVYQESYCRGNVETIDFSVGLAPGTYFVSVEPYSSYNIDHIGIVYNLTATFTEGEYFEKEFNNHSDVSNKIEINKPYTAALQYPGDNDYYTFTAPANSVVAIKFAHDKVSGNSDYFWLIEVYDESGKALSTQYSRGNDDGVVLPVKTAAGPYFIKVAAYSSWDNKASSIKYTVTAAMGANVLNKDATAKSVKYTVDGKTLKINNVPKNTDVYTFLQGITLPKGAKAKLYSSNGKTEIMFGYVATGMKFIVTAEDMKTTKSYTINIKK